MFTDVGRQVTCTWHPCFTGEVKDSDNNSKDGKKWGLTSDLHCDHGYNEAFRQ